MKSILALKKAQLLWTYNAPELAWVVLAFLISATSCRPKFYEAPNPSSTSAGSIDLSKYVAIGSGIEAGFADNALYTEAQNAAYPNLIASKFKEIKSDVQFNLPTINTPNGWSGGTNGKLLLTTPTCATVNITGVNQPGETGVLPFDGDKSLVTNLAVPFIRVNNINSKNVNTGTGFNNPQPYYIRIVDPTTTKGISSEARIRGGSFFTVFLGYTDALRYATSGGNPANLIATDVFTRNIENLLDSLLAANPNAKGLIATIPYVDQFPVITNNNRRITSTTDPARNPIRLTADSAALYNDLIGVSGLFSGATGNRNFYAIQTGTNQIRQMNPAKDFIVAGARLDITGIGLIDPNKVRTCDGNLGVRTELGLKTPILNFDVLDADEIILLRSTIDAWNAAIRTAVDARNTNGKRLAVVDLNGFYNTLTDPGQGIQYGSVIVRANHPNLGPDYGGFYSLDRIHPTPKGQALIANEFLKKANEAFGSGFSLYNPADFRGNIVP